MLGNRTQWDRYIAAYDVTENARQAFVDKMRSISRGGQCDSEQLQRDATELEGFFAEMIAAARPIFRAQDGRHGARTELAVGLSAVSGSSFDLASARAEGPCSMQI